MRARQIQYLFFILVGIYLLADTMGYLRVAHVLKPTLISSLLLYFFLASRAGRDAGGLSPKGRLAGNGAIALALVLSVLGDTFLLGDGNMAFMLGLGSFLLAHVAYVWAFVQQVRAGVGEQLRRHWWVILIFVAYAIGLLSVLWSYLGGLRVPVLAYATAIMAMGVTAAWLHLSRKEEASRWLMWGSWLFILSDSILAANKFMGAEFGLPLYHLWIMVCYLGGQWLMVRGWLGLRS